MWAWINLLLSNLVVSSISKNVLGLGVETESALFLQPGRETKQLVKFLFTRMEDEIPCISNIIRKCLYFVGRFKVSKRHSEINWPLKNWMLVFYWNHSHYLYTLKLDFGKFVYTQRVKLKKCQSKLKNFIYLKLMNLSLLCPVLFLILMKSLRPLLKVMAIPVVEFRNSGNALARVQRVHKPADLWDTTFCTRWFWVF